MSTLSDRDKQRYPWGAAWLFLSFLFHDNMFARGKKRYKINLLTAKAEVAYNRGMGSCGCTCIFLHWLPLYGLRLS